MKSLLIALLLALSMFTMSSCKKSNPVSSPSSSQGILPLKTGNTWIQHYSFFDTTGVTVGTEYDTLVVWKDTLVGNNTWYELAQPGLFWTNKSDGAWIMIVGSNPLAPSLAYKYPAAVGESWTFQIDPSSSAQATVVSIDTLVTVPYGTFTCYKYRLLMSDTQAEYSQDDYLSPNVGFVASDIYFVTLSGTVYRGSHSELVSATFK